MAESFIIEINLSDDIENVIRKCNANFHILSRTADKETVIRNADREGELSGLIQAISDVASVAAEANQTADEARRIASAANAAVMAMQSIVNDMQGDIISLKSRVSQLEGSVATLDERVRALEERPWP